MIRKFFGLQRDAFKDFIKDRGEGMAAALAYFNFLSLAPMVGFILFFSLKLLGNHTTKNDVIPVLSTWFPEQFIIVVKFLLKQSEELDPESIVTLSWVAGITLALATKEYFGQLKDSIEIMWNNRREKFGFKNLLEKAVEDYSITAIALLIIFGLLIIRSYLPHPYAQADSELFGLKFMLVKSLRVLSEFILMFALGLFIFWKAPSYKVKLVDVIPAAVFLGVLEIIGREVMRYHMLSSSSIDVAEALFVVLGWFYYTNLAYIYAAQFSKVYIAKKYNLDVQSLKYN